MIGEILISNNPSFDHICAYVAREEKEGEILAVNGVRDTSAADMAEDFDGAAVIAFERTLNGLPRYFYFFALACPFFPFVRGP